MVTTMTTSPPARERDRQAGTTLVELLVAMSVLAVLTGMILVTWFALQSSFADQARANEARDFARDAVARMVREIRDGTQSTAGGNGVYDASGNQVTISTTFNDPGSSDAGYGDLLLTRFRYNSGTGQLLRIRYAGPGTTNPRTTVLAENVANPTGTPVFSYWYYTTTGAPAKTSTPTTTQQLSIYAVEVDLWIDQNPLHPPAAVKLQSTAQIRNARL